jgi:hypothetical protein
MDCNTQELFCLRFKRNMQELLERHQSAAEAFGPAWESALDEVALDDAEQAAVYRLLIEWAKSAELFICANGNTASAMAQS